MRVSALCRDAPMVRERVMTSQNAPAEFEENAAAPAEAQVEAPVETPVEPALSTAPAEEIASAADQAIDAATVRQQEAIEAVQAVGATVIENVTLAQRAVAEFVSTRIREDIEAQQKLLRCKSFDEVRSVQSKFFETAVAQYRDNAARLFKLGQDIVAKSTPRAH